ncbi:stage 0 sporulation protein J [Collibacillus ludicampi]|uniref:Stage 0 sporulation protein J n=1 Tax=Collibacillus ludicampi TaxID=2771369 RepID=A0AAV4LDG5_9BACL|nr:ParB/RepB/Spo0J family partition protein [Collibacillus ludicampi]GIM45884.1 stage 0 sporulation protein J [Collibacillus ludicampi]
MSTKRQSLGKGLGALLPEVSKEDPVTTVSISQLRANPYQPRMTFDDEKLDELADSIREHGIIQPLIVRKSVRGYEIVAGERRWRAAKKVGLEQVPVVIKEFSDLQMMEIALIENLQREDLNPIEIADAYQKLLDQFNLTQEELAKKVGQSRSHVANFLRLLNLPKEIRDYVSRGTLSMGHARALLGLTDKEQMILLAKKIIEEDLNVRTVEAFVSRLNSTVPRETKKTTVTKSKVISQYEERFREKLGTAVRIQQGKKKGKIEIEYFSYDDLERILSMFE